jgi:hypothetical protein
MRYKIACASDSDILLKLDFQNAFNTIRRDHIADCLLKHAPDLLPIFSACYSEPSFLTFGDEIFSSDEGLQQGDPLAPVYFCVGIHDILCSLSSPFKTAYLDDVALLGDPLSVLHDLTSIISYCDNIGLKLNSSKCELSLLGNSSFDPFSEDFLNVLPDFKRVCRTEITLLGAAMGESSLNTFLSSFSETFSLLHECLLQLSAHDALFLLRNCFAVPKLLHTLRTSTSFERPDLLQDIDTAILKSVSSILNVRLDISQKSQVTLPTKLGGLGIVSAGFVASSAFLSSTHAADPVCRAISSDWCLANNISYQRALCVWEGQCTTASPPTSTLDRQKSWTLPLHKQQADFLLSSVDSHNRARLLACKAPGSGDWLNALPSIPLGLHLSDQQLRIAASIRLGAPVFLEHPCSLCGSLADSFGGHAFSCSRSTGRHLRHSLMNDVINRALHSIPIPTRLEPTGLLPDSNLKPDGVSVIPWATGKSLAWDVTCAHPLAQSWLPTSQRAESAVANVVEAKKRLKYKDLDLEFHFEPVSVETLGGIGDSTMCFLRKLGERIVAGTGDDKASLFLRQRLAIAIQIGNCACLTEILPSPGSSLPPTDF